MSANCCTPSDNDPTPGQERTGRIALAVLLTINAAVLATVVYLLR